MSIDIKVGDTLKLVKKIYIFDEIGDYFNVVDVEDSFIVLKSVKDNNNLYIEKDEVFDFFEKFDEDNCCKFTFYLDDSNDSVKINDVNKALGNLFDKNIDVANIDVAYILDKSTIKVSISFERILVVSIKLQNGFVIVDYCNCTKNILKDIEFCIYKIIKRLTNYSEYHKLENVFNDGFDCLL